jgi:hypothetical protein
MAIFVSYRREDAAGHAGRLVDRLTARFGADGVFMDVQDIAPGDKFAASIDDTIARCDCLVAVIGPRWVDLMQQRAPGLDDFVRHEIGAALRRDITVVPVLVGGARMPSRQVLPADLAALSQRNAVEIRDDRFEDDVARLGDALAKRGTVKDGSVRRVGGRTYVALSVLLVALLAAIGVAFFGTRPAEVDLDGAWVAEMQKPGQRPYRIRLTLVHTGERISGLVQYPTGDGPIHDGLMSGGRLSFSTSHVPQFASSPALIRYEGEVTDDGGIRLTSVDEAGVASGVARKPPD